MGERVGTQPGYCDTAEDIMDFAGQMNAAAGARNRLLWPPGMSRYPKEQPDVDDVLVKTFRAIAWAADSMVRGCTRCELSRIRPDALDQPCSLDRDFGQMRMDARTQIDILRQDLKHNYIDLNA